MLGRTVAQRLHHGVWSDEVIELARGCDGLVLNLECCVSARGEATRLIQDKPFFFRSPPEGVDSLRVVDATVAGVANNHALDFGPDALADTLAHLRAAGIVSAGAGLDEDSARRGVLVPVGGLMLGVLAVSDHPPEFAATADAPGIAFADLRRSLPSWVAEELGRLRDAADLVIAFPHWGPNMTDRPARWQRRRANELVAAGAHLVAGHSAHVFHGIERLPDGLVLHDLGDALDDYAVDPDLRNDLGIMALWQPDGEPRLQLVALGLDFCHTRLAEGDDADWIAARLARACEELGASVERLGDARFALVD